MNNEGRPLWAPWRIEYILGPKDGECFLCNRQEPSDNKDDFMVIARGRNAFIMLNAFPYNSGHLLIAPYKHIGDIAEVPKEILHEMMDLCTEAKELLKKVMNPDGFNIGFNLGKAAGAGLEEHLHMHVVPRWVGDTNFMPILDNTHVMPQSLKDTANILKENFVIK